MLLFKLRLLFDHNSGEEVWGLLVSGLWCDEGSGESERSFLLSRLVLCCDEKSEKMKGFMEVGA